jgi:hypothetical protein
VRFILIKPYNQLMVGHKFAIWQLLRPFVLVARDTGNFFIFSAFRAFDADTAPGLAALQRLPREARAASRRVT